MASGLNLRKLHSREKIEPLDAVFRTKPPATQIKRWVEVAEKDSRTKFWLNMGAGVMGAVSLIPWLEDGPVPGPMPYLWIAAMTAAPDLRARLFLVSVLGFVDCVGVMLG